jgi:hypothetical protein
LVRNEGVEALEKVLMELMGKKVKPEQSMMLI